MEKPKQDPVVQAAWRAINAAEAHYKQEREEEKDLACFSPFCSVNPGPHARTESCPR